MISLHIHYDFADVAADLHVTMSSWSFVPCSGKHANKRRGHAGVHRSHTGSYTVIKPCMVSFTLWLLQLLPDANQSAAGAGVVDKAEGIREIKLRWHAVIYITIDLPLLQINHLFPSFAFLIFASNSGHTNYSACGVTLDVWLGGHAGNCVNPGCGFTPELCFGGFRQKGAVLPLCWLLTKVLIN